MLCPQLWVAEMTSYKLPNSWRWVALDDICLIERGISFPRSAMSNDFEEGYLACLRTTNIQEYVNWYDLIYIPESYVKSPQKLIQVGDILISTANSHPLVGKVSFVDQLPINATFGGFISVLRASDLIDPYFLFAYLGSDVSQAKMSDISYQTTNIANLSIRELSKFPVPLPTLAEQHEIVRILRQANRLRQLRAEADKQSEALALATFNDVFGFIDKNAYRPVRLEKIAEIVSGVTKGRNLPARETVNVPYLRVANVQAGYLDLSEIKTIDVLPADVEKYALQPGDVLLTEGGDFDKLGRGAIWEHDLPDCIHQNHVFRVRLDPETVLPLFFHYYLQSTYARHYFLRAAKRTTNLASINITQLAALPVPVPPLVMQEQFITAVSQIRAILSKQSRTVAEISQLAQAVMVHAFTGKLTQTFRDQNHVTLTQIAHQRDEALKSSIRTTDLLTELAPRIARSFVRDTLSPAQQKLLTMIENQDAYVTGDYSEIADDLPPNEVSRDLDLLKQIGLVKAVSVPVTPGQLGQIFFTKAYRALLPGDDTRETDLSILPEVEVA
jgi:type I restriction enzyme, S subunit